MTKLSLRLRNKQRYASTQKWLSEQGLVVAGYWDKVAGTNLVHLVTLWRDVQLDGKSLEDEYPYAAEHFQVEVVEPGENKYIRDLLPKFDGCPHIKIWCMGHEVDLGNLPTITTSDACKYG